MMLHAVAEGPDAEGVGHVWCRCWGEVGGRARGKYNCTLSNVNIIAAFDRVVHCGRPPGRSTRAPRSGRQPGLGEIRGGGRAAAGRARRGGRGARHRGLVRALKSSNPRTPWRRELRGGVRDAIGPRIPRIPGISALEPGHGVVLRDLLVELGPPGALATAADFARRRLPAASVAPCQCSSARSWSIAAM